jgi:hypothetical protein
MPRKRRSPALSGTSLVGRLSQEPVDFQTRLPLSPNILCFDRCAIHHLLFAAGARASLSADCLPGWTDHLVAELVVRTSCKTLPLFISQRVDPG